MVNPKQLRLGNYIHDRGGKVLRIDFMEYVRDGYDTKVGQLMHLEGQEVHPMTEYTDYANPIPIIEEWLFRMGFEKDIFWSDYIFNDIFITLNDTDNTYMLDIDILHIKIQYVHQLQNLYFALTGEELEIKDLDPQNVHKIS